MLLAVKLNFRRPSLIAAGLHVVSSTTNRRTTVHYDTAGLHLARWGCTLYRRSKGTWTVSVDGQDVQSFGGGGDAPPQVVVDFLTAYHRGMELVPLVEMRTRQRHIELSNAKGVLVCIDDERSEGIPAPEYNGIRRLVVSSPKGARRQVAVVARAMRSAGAGPTDGVPAYLAVAGVRPPPPEVPMPDVSPRSTVVEAIQGALAASVVRLIRNDGPTRCGEDPEGLHQARVATRRLRSDLRTFLPLLDARWVEDLRADLSELADDLGRVRDADVLLERLRTSARDMPDTEAVEGVLCSLVRTREADRARLLVVMRGQEYLRLLDRLASAAVSPAIVNGGNERASDVLPPLARETWVRLRRRVRSLGSQPTDEDLHAVRIAAKRARYAAEAVGPAVGAEAAAFARAMADLQTHLGDLHDAVVAADWLRAAAAAAPPRETFVAGELRGRQLEQAGALRASWKRVWQAARHSRLRRWM